MKHLAFAAAFLVAFVSAEASAQKAPVCKNLPTVDACVKCSLQKGGLSMFSQAGIERWCKKQIASRAGGH
jgi:hypothetical protein